MRFLCVLSMILAVCTANAAQRPNPRAGAAGGNSGTSSTTAAAPTAARAATRGATRTGTAATTPGTAQTAARAATRAPTRTNAAATTASGAKPAAGAPTAARAAATQKVISSGTKVAGAAKNLVVNEECQQKYDGCMDAFCMMDNASGGRCLCSNKNAEFDNILAEIERLDSTTYQMVTAGVERLEMGNDADAVIKNANDVVSKLMAEEQANEARKNLMSLWGPKKEDDDDDPMSIFNVGGTTSSVIDGKVGDDLHAAAQKLCLAQIPECNGDVEMLKMLYTQRVRSDCTAYENSLKQRRNESEQKLLTAESELRATALEQYRAANKYDLGQCAIEFRQCMATTGGCNEDFTGCVGLTAAENARKRTGAAKSQGYVIEGTLSKITIANASYDTLVAKKPLCETVLKQCQAVGDQVWDVFLRDIAPTIKSAELIAESDLRQSCLSTVSACFQKACKDTIDPNDPDGSYDLCLSQPSMVRSLCKVELDPCVEATGGNKSPMWDYIEMTLAAMRVDACTTQVKECLTDVNRCGPDYAGCVGLDTESIIKMCPYEKLTGCLDRSKAENKDIAGDQFYDAISNMIEGIMLNVDNSMLTTCQNALNEAMIRVCGDTENCDDMILDENTGARSLEYKVCKIKTDKDGKPLGVGEEISYEKCRNETSQITDEELGRNYNAAALANQGVCDANGNNCKGGMTTGSIMQQSALGKDGSLLWSGVVDGQIDWSKVDYDPSGATTSSTAIGGNSGDATKKTSTTVTFEIKDGELSCNNCYMASNIDSKAQARVKSEIASINTSIQAVVSAIEADQVVNWCMYGREVPLMNVTGTSGARRKLTGRTNIDNNLGGRFPGLTAQVRNVIAASALKKAKDNYYAKYDELIEKTSKDYVDLGERVSKIQNSNAMDARREWARLSCINLASGSGLGGILTDVKRKTGGTRSGNEGDMNTMTGYGNVEQWNYKETTTTSFNWDDNTCERCIRSQRCENEKRKWCKTWGQETQHCNTIRY